MPTTLDRIRQIVVTIAAVFCVIGTLVGVGVIGTRVEESSGGTLAADATLLAPAKTAFSIWSVIYLGLLAYVVWQWLPAGARSVRGRRIGWLAAASMVLNAVWLLVTQAGWIWVSVLVIVALVVVLGLILRTLTALPPEGRAEAVAVDGTFGLYTGWVSIATAANIAAAGTASGLTLGSLDHWVAALVLAAAAGIGVLLARSFGGRLTLAAAMAWGMAWIAVGRLNDQPRSVVTGVAAIVAAAVVVLAAVMVRRGPARQVRTVR